MLKLTWGEGSKNDVGEGLGYEKGPFILFHSSTTNVKHLLNAKHEFRFQLLVQHPANEQIHLFTITKEIGIYWTQLPMMPLKVRKNKYSINAVTTFLGL